MSARSIARLRFVEVLLALVLLVVVGCGSGSL